MITAVDTNVLMDVFGPTPEFATSSASALRRCLREGALVACEVVWAEVAAGFRDPAESPRGMGRLGVAFSAIDPEVAVDAGIAWKSYRDRGGTRDRMIADFLIGAHAQLRADRLLTRDRGFYRIYFEGLEILDPSRA